MSNSAAPPLLAAHQITKRFGAFAALDSVDFAINAGEIHALLGENGAGKSTLMGVLSGLLRPTGGEIRLNGKPVRFASPRDAQQSGIGMVHQHFLLVPPLTVAENLLLGASPKMGGPLSYPAEAVIAEAQAIASRLGWHIPWKTPCGDLPVGVQQRVEILKALRGQTRVLIFDEPTAVLSPTETPELFATIRTLAGEGRGIVFISHKLDEVLSLAKTVTVLRRGRVVFRTNTLETTASDLARAMVQSDAPSSVPVSHPNVKASPASGEGASLFVQNLTVYPKNAPRPLLDNLSFTVEPGEIFGVAGVDGNGQTELAGVLSGLLTPTQGQISVGEKPVASEPGAFRRAGVAVVPADRHERGLALPLSLTENITLGVWDDPEFGRGPFLLWPRLKARTTRLVSEFDIRAGGPNAPAASLSGGNQQKVVLARALATENLRVLIVVNPTRGLDVGAIATVHAALRAAQKRGVAVVLISTELVEVLTLATKSVAVLFEGRFSGVVSPSASREVLGRLMGGNSG